MEKGARTVRAMMTFVLKRVRLLTVATVAIAGSPCGYSQFSSGAPAAPLSQPSDAAVTDQPSTLGMGSRSQTQPDEISAAQLEQLLRENPEALIEVKSLIADEAQRDGKAVEANAISDQALIAQIESSEVVRQDVTQYLRARGYLSDDDLSGLQGESGSDALQHNLPVSAGGLDDGGQSELAAPEPKLDAAKASVAGSEDSANAAGSNRNEKNITDPPLTMRRQAPYNLRSLRDLYTQQAEPSDKLGRFGSDLFVSGNFAATRPLSSGLTTTPSALDIPLGPDYVLGPGDQVSINLWGGMSQTLTRMVDREGRLTVLESGPIQVAGLTMAKAEGLVQDALQSQYRNLRVTLTVARLRSVRIYVVGDVRKPGAYELSALASPISALFAAGGPSASGSLRILRHYRNEKLIGEIDLYDFMLHGVRSTDDRLEAGDTLLVPPVGPQIAVFGAVKRQAIYEMKDETDINQVLDEAGGVTVAAALTHITIERVEANQQREIVSVDANDAGGGSATDGLVKKTLIHDGDRIHVWTVLPRSESVIYLQGHIARPGRIAFRENLQIHDVLRTYDDLLPEPADRGEIVRLVRPDLHPETIEFDVPAVLAGTSSIALQAFDTIRIFGRYERDGPAVSIRGEVLKPGTYPLFEGMTAAELVRTAGGFKRDALLDRADLASYRVDGTRVVIQRRDVPIGDAVLKIDQDADVHLRAGDVLTVHQLTGWNDIGASIEIEGEVSHPGSYGFEEGEHLSDVLRRAGGFRATAYPEGAVLTRPEVATLEQKSREELIRQIESSSAAARLSPAVGGSEQGAALQLMQQQQEQLIARLRSQPVTGRLVIHVSSAIDSWAGSAADIEVRSGDVLRIPKRPQFVLVSGQVYNPSAITYSPGKSAGWYLRHAGGASAIANQKEIFIVRANGDVVGRRSENWYSRDVLSTRLDAGDTIVVPQRIIGPSLTWRNLLSTAQIATSLAIAAAVAGL